MITTLKQWKIIKENKHLGEEFHYDNSTILYHKSNPYFRNNILKEGLKPMKGDSYSLHSPEDSALPAIFMYTGGEYDNSYDDDIYEITCNNLKIKIYKDKETYSDYTNTYLTYENIPLSNIKLIYKGTGDAL